MKVVFNSWREYISRALHYDFGAWRLPLFVGRSGVRGTTDYLIVYAGHPSMCYTMLSLISSFGQPLLQATPGSGPTDFFAITTSTIPLMDSQTGRILLIGHVSSSGEHTWPSQFYQPTLVHFKLAWLYFVLGRVSILYFWFTILLHFSSLFYWHFYVCPWDVPLFFHVNRIHIYPDTTRNGFFFNILQSWCRRNREYYSKREEHHLCDDRKCTLLGMSMFLLDRLLCSDTRAHDGIVAQSAIYSLIYISLTQCILSVQ